MRPGSERRAEEGAGYVAWAVLPLGKHNSKGKGMSRLQPQFAGGNPAAARSRL